MNIWVFFTITALGVVAFYSLVLHSRSCIRALTLGVILTFYVRVVHFLEPHIYPWHDGYHYFGMTESILATHALQPAPSTVAFYPYVDVQLSFPFLGLLGAHLSQILGLTDPTILRQGLQAIFGPIFFLALFVLYSDYLGRTWALVAAFTCTMLDPIIFFQIEYHSQGLAIIFLALFLVGVRRDKMYPHIWTFLILPALLLTHHFTAVLLIGILWLYAVISAFSEQLGRLGLDLRDDLNPGWFNNLLMLVSIALVSLFTYFQTQLLNQIVLSVVYSLIPQAGGSYPGILQPPGNSTFIDSFKPLLKGIFGLGGISMAAIAIWRQGWRQSGDYRSTLFYTYLAGAVALILPVIMVLRPSMLFRIFLIGYIFAVPLAIHCLKEANKSVDGVGLFVAVLSLVCMMGISAGVSPSLIDHQADIGSDSMYQETPIGAQSPAAGAFLERVDDDEIIHVTPNTRMTARYYGTHTPAHTHYITKRRNYRGLGVLDTGVSIYPNPADSKVYSNGRIVVVNATKFSN